MYQVLNWMERVALSDLGIIDRNMVESASRMNVTDLCEFVSHQPIALPVEEAVNRLVALRDLQRNYKRMSGDEFKEAMTIAHFATYFGTAISRAFYDDYPYVVGQWADYTYPDTTPDFRDVDRMRMSEPGTLHKRREKQNIATTHISETNISYGVDEFSEEFDVSWQALKNDDLGKIKETPDRMVKASARWLDQFVSALYDNATTQAALVALGAVYAGTGRLTAANLAIGINAMAQRVDANGNLMNIKSLWLVIPKVLQMQAEVILGSTQMAGGALNDLNVIPRFIKGYRIDPYIAFTIPNVPWYLVADPSELPGITVARMDGVPGPISYMKASNIERISGAAPAEFLMGSFETGDITFGVEDIIGGWDNATYVGVTDFRAIYYSSGTTP